MADTNPEITYGEPLEYTKYDEMNDYYTAVEHYGRAHADHLYGYKFTSFPKTEEDEDQKCEGCKNHSTLIQDHKDPESGCVGSSVTCTGCIENQPNQLAHMDEGGCLYEVTPDISEDSYEFMHDKKWKKTLELNPEVSIEHPNDKWDVVSILPTLNEDYYFLYENKEKLNWKLVTMNPCFTIQDMMNYSHLPWDMNWICMNPHMTQYWFTTLLPIMVQSPDSWMSIKLALKLNKNIPKSELKEFYEHTLDELVGEGKKYQFFKY